MRKADSFVDGTAGEAYLSLRACQDVVVPQLHHGGCKIGEEASCTSVRLNKRRGGGVVGKLLIDLHHATVQQHLLEVNVVEDRACTLVKENARVWSIDSRWHTHVFQSLY